jgi:three-Cys-motif partner protein
MYCEMFATAMKKRWDARVYIDLFAGPGYSRFRGASRVVLGSPLIALTVPDPFDLYVFCEANTDALSALRKRVQRHRPGAHVRFVSGDVNDNIDRVIDEIPPDRAGYRVLSFCFVDPFSLSIRFETIRRLADGRAIDFMILLALGMDANRNLATYLRAESDRIDSFLGTAGWRLQWAEARKQGEPFIPFLARRYSEAMSQIGYLLTPVEEMQPVRSRLKNLPLYYLAFFSKHSLGKEFWSEVRKYATEQLGLGL